MKTKMYNNQDLISPEAEMEIEEYFSELDGNDDELKEDKILLELCDKAKVSHRRRRRTARKAKAHQIKLATTLGKQRKEKRKSLYRWSPVWHKMKRADISTKKFKERSSGASTIDALKEYQTTPSYN